MVGGVLLQRMREEDDFAGLEPVFFSTSNIGGASPKEGDGATLKDATNFRDLASCDLVLSTQGGEYTTEVYAPLRQSGWKGYWIDAASTLRMSDAAVIVLDPVNADVIERGLAHGVRTFAGGNCTVSLMLMGNRRAAESRPRRVDHVHDLSGSVRRRRRKNAGVGEADGVSHRPHTKNSIRKRARSRSHGHRRTALQLVARPGIRGAPRRQSDSMDR